ncbi:MAG: hypothetical protein ACXWUG_25280, partial [Polyangiales bacterium]
MSLIAVATLGGACRSPSEEPPGACASPLSTHPEGAPWVPTADRTEAIAATFEITVDLRHPALSSTWREPQTAPVTVKTVDGSLRAIVGVKRFAQLPHRLYVALYV